jgi:DNA-binding CsgD family transcriptional regulator
MSGAVLDSLNGVVRALGQPAFAARGLQALQDSVRVGSWSVYELRSGQAPVLHLSATHQGPDLTQACFAAYARGLYLRDSSFNRVRGRRPDEPPLISAMHADAAPNPEHRDAIYRAHRVLERLSVAALQPDGAVLAVNLYHHEAQGPFSEAERERFHALAPVLHTAVQRHIDLKARAPATDRRQALRAAAPDLSERELDVCERLLRGWSHDGVASDLGLSVSTVKTYRARAFARLGLHFRSELFARFGGVRESKQADHG